MHRILGYYTDYVTAIPCRRIDTQLLLLSSGYDYGLIGDVVRIVPEVTDQGCEVVNSGGMIGKYF